MLNIRTQAVPALTEINTLDLAAWLSAHDSDITSIWKWHDGFYFLLICIWYMLGLKVIKLRLIVEPDGKCATLLSEAVFLSFAHLVQAVHFTTHPNLWPGSCNITKMKEQTKTKNAWIIQRTGFISHVFLCVYQCESHLFDVFFGLGKDAFNILNFWFCFVKENSAGSQINWNAKI